MDAIFQGGIRILQISHIYLGVNLEVVRAIAWLTHMMSKFAAKIKQRIVRRSHRLVLQMYIIKPAIGCQLINTFNASNCDFLSAVTYNTSPQFNATNASGSVL